MAELVRPGAQFAGWYDAPFPFGRTEFLLTVGAVAGEEWTGSGEDKQGAFSVKGKLLEDGLVTFVKDYLDGSHTGVEYSGQADTAAGTLQGEYKFKYRKVFISLDICEKFSMTWIQE